VLLVAISTAVSNITGNTAFSTIQMEFEILDLQKYDAHINEQIDARVKLVKPTASILWRAIQVILLEFGQLDQDSLLEVWISDDGGTKCCTEQASSSDFGEETVAEALQETVFKGNELDLWIRCWR